MNFGLDYTKQFKKDYKKAKKRGRDLSKIDEIIRKIKDGEKLDETCQNHPLIGNYRGKMECHIEPDWILIYEISISMSTVRLCRTGTHSGLFK